METQMKYTIQISKKEKPFKISKEIKDELKGVLSAKMIRNMKYESILCPLINDEIPFLECFLCESFIRRFKGEIHCSGLKGPK